MPRATSKAPSPPAPRDPVAFDEVFATLNDDQKDLLIRWPIGANFDLEDDATVVVAGAYSGRVMDLLEELYHDAHLIGYEPQMWVFRKLALRALDHPMWTIYPFGIGLQTAENLPMGEYHTDGASFVNVNSREQGTGDMVEINDAFGKIGLGKDGDSIDLMVLNMEGYEFDLVPHIISTGLVHHVGQFAIQWHTGFGNDGHRDELFARLAETHDMVVDFYPRWTWHIAKGAAHGITPEAEAIIVDYWKRTLGLPA